MRHESPLLISGLVGGGVGADAIAGLAGSGSGTAETACDTTPPTNDEMSAATGGDDAAVIRNIFNTRRHHSRAGSIPEEG